MSLRKKAVLFMGGCIVIASVLIGLLGYLNADSGFNESYLGKVKSDGAHVTTILDVKYPGQWNLRNGKLFKGDKNMEGLTEEIDTLAGNDAITIFNGNTRVSTTVKQNGSRAVGSQAGTEISQEVLGQGKTVAVQTDVVGVPYYTCYMPIVSSSGEKIGMLFVGTPSAPIIAIEREFIRNTVITIIVLILLMSFVAYTIIGKAMVPVEAVQHTVARIADGDLRVADLEVNGSDELAMLAADTNKMKNALRDLLENLNISAQQVADGSGEIYESSNSLSKGAATQAASVEELSASISEIASQTASNAENAERANEITSKARSNAQEGNGDMQRMLQSMEDINASSTDIAKIIKVIDEIAFQTNILALNAAVESARAGQHGKGFAVVAEEVRNLAARSGKAAKEITEMIEGSISRVNEGREIANKTAEMLATLVGNVSEVADYVAAIAKASKEQSLAIEQINQGVQQVSQVVQTNSYTAEKGATASQGLNQQAALLHEEVKKFRV